MVKRLVLTLFFAVAVAGCGGQPQPQSTEVPTVAPPRPQTSPTSAEAVGTAATPRATGEPSKAPTGASSPTPAAQPPSASPTAASPSVPPLQPSPQGPEASGGTVALRVAEYNTYKDSYGDLHIVGIVRNESGSDVTDPMVTALLADSSGSEAATAEATVLLVGLPPGGSLPFEAVVPEPPEFEGVRFTAEGYAAEAGSMPSSQVRVTGGTIQRSEEGYVVKGRVENPSSETLSMVSVAVIVRDGAGRIIGVGSTDVGEAISPSGSAEFEIELLELGGSPAGLEFRAEGYPG